MFCHKCGAQIAEGAAFCQKCGTKLVHEDVVQHPAGAPAPSVAPQQSVATEPMVAEGPQQPPANDSTKPSRRLRKAAGIGRVLMWGSLLLLMLHLPISPAILVAAAAIGIILSALGSKRPLGLSKIIELVVAVVLLVIVAVSTLSSGGSGDKYVQMVKGGTLSGYPQMTVGEAFDGFLSNPKWESGVSDDNVRFVNVTGGILYYEKDAELAVQFIVDEKDGSFQYNACEIDGVSQNNLVVWGLLETIYNGDSVSSSDSTLRGLDSQSSPDFMSDEIVIGETQSYDNEFGNIEVTLDYVAFTDKLENTLLGGYIYPDEGNVFLWAGITVKNIGTENGDLITAWNTVVYDGTYEFRSHSTIGEPLTNIAPLTASTEGAIIFEVPTIVMESNKSLMLNINDGAGGVVLSYVIRPGDSATPADGSTSASAEQYGNENDSQGKVLLCGLPIDEVIGMYSSDVAANYGEFDDWANDCMMYGVHDYEESTLFDDGWIEFNMNGYSVDSFSSDPINLTFDGQSLRQGFDDLVTILGNDYIIQGESEYSWWIAWYYDGCEISFEFPLDTAGLDPDIPTLVSVSSVT